MMDEEKEDDAYNEWYSENIGDLKAEFLTEYSVDDLIHHFYWEELTIEDFFEQEEAFLEEYCKECYEGYCDVEETKADLNRMIERI